MAHAYCQQLISSEFDVITKSSESRYDFDIVKGKRKMSDPDRANVRFGTRLRAWREGRKLSMLEISKRTGLAHANLSGIERGARPASDNDLALIASIPEMEIDVDQLLAWRILAKAEQPQLTYIKAELEKMGIDFPDIPTGGTHGFAGT